MRGATQHNDAVPPLGPGSQNARCVSPKTAEFSPAFALARSNVFLTAGSGLVQDRGSPVTAQVKFARKNIAVTSKANWWMSAPRELPHVAGLAEGVG